MGQGVGGSEAVQPRPRGRPRDKAAQEAVLQAASDEVRRVGYLGLTIERVAARSGVAKTTIYRWWPTKAHIVIDAIAPLIEAANPVASGRGASLRADLTRAVQRVSDGFQAPVGQHVIAGLIAECAQDEEVAEAYRQRILHPRREAATEVLRYWQERGEIDPEADLDFIQDLYAGAIFYRALVLGSPPNSAFQDRLINTILDSVRPG